MNTDVINGFTKSGHVKRADVKVGDTVKLHLKIKEAGKERIQIFEGIVLSMSGQGASKNITVRKMSHGVGVEKIIPLNMPALEKIEIIKRGTVKRSKLYYMRDKIGKKAMDVSRAENVYFTDEVEQKEEETKQEEEAVEKQTEEKK